MFETVLHRFQEGGVYMYFILLVGLYATYLIVDRMYALFVATRPVSVEFRSQLRTYLKNGDIQGAKDFAAKANNVVSPVVELACKLRSEGAGDDELQSRLDEAVTERINKIDRRTSFLAVVGNVATLIGLLGTISGMITSFAAVSGASAAERAAKLSLGISEAMNCTAFGLLVAIPSLLAYAFLQNKTEVVVSGMTENVSKIYNDLVFLYEARQSSTANR